MIHLANYEKKVGGGWSFMSNFVRGASKHLGNYEESDIYFVAGPTLASHDDVERAKRDGKKIVFRIDNAVRNSRNRNTGMSRMKAFADAADLVIYQSKWARDYLYPFTKKDGPVIINGVDTSVFNSNGRQNQQESYLYVRSQRDETKNFEMARHYFSREWQRRQDINLNIVGKFSAENLDYDFDFYQGEKYFFLGEQPPRTMADIYRSSKYFLYSFFCDACSNCLIEAKVSGCEIIDVFGMLETGGAPEIMRTQDLSLERMIEEYLDVIL